MTIIKNQTKNCKALIKRFTALQLSSFTASLKRSTALRLFGSTASNGFTFVEIAMVVGILALLSTIVIVNMNIRGNKANANNIKRRTDLESIQGALDLRAQETGDSLPSGLVNGLSEKCVGVGSDSFNLSNISWSTSVGADIKFDVRSCDDASCVGETWPGTPAFSSSPATLNIANASYFQYKATYNVTETPWDQTTDTDFNAGMNSSTMVSGGSVSLGPQPFTCGTNIAQDIEGNSYNTVQIGTQCWMASNMMTTKYPNGTSITRGPTGATWNGSDNGYYAYPPNTSNNAEETLVNIQSQKLGFMYQWSAAMNGVAGCNGTGASQPQCSSVVQGVCPSGWHIPSHYEVTLLEKSVGSNPGAFPYDTTTTGSLGTNEGTNLKSGGSSGFVGLMTGYRGTVGNFGNRNTTARLRSSSVGGSGAWFRELGSSVAIVYRNTISKAEAQAVRCLRNAPPSPPFISTGTYTSSVKDTGQMSDFTTVSWISTIPSSATTMTIETQSANLSSGADCATGTIDWAGGSGWQSVATIATANANGSANIPNALDGKRCVQYRATLNTSDTAQTPSLDSITIKYFPGASKPILNDVAISATSSLLGDARTFTSTTYNDFLPGIINLTGTLAITGAASPNDAAQGTVEYSTGSPPMTYTSPVISGNCYDLTADLAPLYLGTIPKDPKTGTDENTGYLISVDPATKVVCVKAPGAENNEVIENCRK